jgi:hypothetical protein
MNERELLEAVQIGDIESVEFGLKNKLNPNYSAEEDGGYTLLHWAAQEGYVEIIELLAEHGADLNPIDENRITPLFNAAGIGDFETVETLVRSGADVNFSSGNGPALHNAAVHGHTAIVEFLLANGANVNATCDEGYSPLLLAVSHEHDGLAEILLSHGAIKYVVEGLPETIQIFNKVLDKYDSVGYEQLNEAEKTLVCVLNLKYEVESRGFSKFYQSTSAYLSEDAVSALERIGAAFTAQLLRQANDWSKSDTKGVDDESINELTDAFFEDEEDLNGLLEKYIQENQDQILELDS